MRLHLTSIGDPDARAEYARELREFLLGHDVFDADQRARIEINPMRAFDWDAPEIVAVTEAAPKMIERLSDADAEHFDEVRRMLDGAGIDYELDPRLVRGLDYYTRTVFEFRSDVARGAERHRRRRALRPPDRAARRARHARAPAGRPGWSGSSRCSPTCAARAPRRRPRAATGRSSCSS